VNVVTSTRSTNGVRFPAGSVNFSLRHRVHTDSGTQPTSYETSTGGSFPGGQMTEHETDHSSPSSAEVNIWSYIPTPPIGHHGLIFT
jgi:hypothetical protein